MKHNVGGFLGGSPPVTSPRKWARLAGILWLICIACGLFAEAYVHEKLILPHDPSGTIRNIFSNEQLYRLGFALRAFAERLPIWH